VKFVLFYHSLVSDWNHGNAHFLRGIVAELLDRGHSVEVYEPRDSWSRRNLVADHGTEPLTAFARAFPRLHSRTYDSAHVPLEQILDDADVVLVHEWNEHALVQRIGEHHAAHRGYRLFFHDTHHRAVTDPDAMAAYDLSGYDGVLAYGQVIRELYLRRSWARQAWTWHEAADTRVFHPLQADNEGDVVWIGNWGDDERGEELREFLIDPVHALGLRTRVHGVRYPADALTELEAAGIDYRGWIANHDVPRVFAAFRLTVHVPRRPYVQRLRGIPTIRPFEALACGIPLISAPWEDAEHLFTPGRDFLVARDGAEMQKLMRDVLHDRALAESLAAHGLATIRARHTCAHRVDQLLEIAGVHSEAEAAGARA
jgi:spore maturation protein CgeB